MSTIQRHGRRSVSASGCRRLFSIGLSGLTIASGVAVHATDVFDRSILPLLRGHCLSCHSATDPAGELDLERFTSVEKVREDPATWQHVLEQVSLGEMPPAESRPFSPELSHAFTGWIRGMLDEVARASAGDPGPVILRRLSNREYTATIQDLTGVESLEPAREFPADGAAGEGFTNAGAALVMSPALLQKYLDAAKDVAKHCVLLPDGVRFSASDSPQDWASEVLGQIRGIYARHTSPTDIVATVEGAGAVTNTGGAIPLDRYLDALQGRGDAAGLSPKYLGLLRHALTSSEPSPLLDDLRARFAARRLTAADIEPVQRMLWRFTTVGHIGKANGPKSWQEPVQPFFSQPNPRVEHGESAGQDPLVSDPDPATSHVALITVPDGSDARARFAQACDEFRAIFPRVVCYSTIVPVDEVVTLTLYHREDDLLKQLLLDEDEARQLDRLWDELLFVTEAPLKQVAVFQQLWQYATQGGDTAVFEPAREAILRAAAEFEARRAAADEPQRRAVIDLARRAWRRPLTAAETFELSGLPPRTMLVRVLTSPHFLYRAEAVPETTGPVTDHELATRLSYFLWSSLPDAELRESADAGMLRDPDVLAAQARRMLRDGKVRRLATEFGCQWLHVRDLATLDEKSDRHFPEFAGLRSDMQEEVERFFIDVFANDRDVLSLVDADHTFVNGPLARHYGFMVDGEAWRRVEGLQARGRGGVLGFAATLAKQAGASRTSAILRGTWISETLLGERLPMPPKDVPVLPEEPPAGLSERQLIERHSSDPRCAGCHRRIDPFGFALEGFDAIGRARAADTATTLPDGTAIEGLDGLRDYLTRQRRDDVLRQFSRKLLGYALGRAIQLSDEPLIDAMVAADGRRAADLVELVVRSAQFRTIRGRSASEALPR